MNVDGLALHHVKSHLQKYRQGKLTVRDWRESYRIGSGEAQASSSSWQPLGPLRVYESREMSRVWNVQGSPYLRLQAEKAYDRYLKAQRAYVGDVVNNACKVLANRYLGGGKLAGYGSYVGQGFNGVRTMTQMPTSYHNQLNACNAYNLTETIRAQTATEGENNNFQALIAAPAAEGRFSNNLTETIQAQTAMEGENNIYQAPIAAPAAEGSFSHNLTETIQAETAMEGKNNSCQAPIAAPAAEGSFSPLKQSAGFQYQDGTKYHSGHESMVGLAWDEEPLDVFFNWDDDNPKAQQI